MTSTPTLSRQGSPKPSSSTSWTDRRNRRRFRGDRGHVRTFPVPTLRSTSARSRQRQHRHRRRDGGGPQASALCGRWRRTESFSSRTRATTGIDDEDETYYFKCEYTDPPPAGIAPSSSTPRRITCPTCGHGASGAIPNGSYTATVDEYRNGTELLDTMVYNFNVGHVALPPGPTPPDTTPETPMQPTAPQDADVRAAGSRADHRA